MTVGTPDVAAGPPGLQNLTVGAFGPPYLLRDAADPKRRQVIDRQEQDEEGTQKHPSLLCRVCSHTITSEDQRIEVAGSHRHTFFNPAGIVFELGCFAKAPGCGLLGEASDEFSWFTGYVWRVALCVRCGAHLGWHFQSGETGFYGLIVSNLQSGQ